MTEFPEDITERLKFFCDANNLGLTQMITENVNIVIMADRDKLNANEVALLAAKMLLDGIIQGVWFNLNDQALKAEKRARTQ